MPGERIHAEVDVTNFTTRKIKETSLSLVQVMAEHFRRTSIPAGSSRTVGEFNLISQTAQKICCIYILKLMGERAVGCFVGRYLISE